MAHPAVQELNNLLHSLPALKPPGVSKSKVDAATKLCLDVQNIAVEPLFVDSLLAALQQSPVTHKLGVLYIIDSIMRQWVVTGAAHAGGVRKMTDNLPLLMNEYLTNVSAEQKERLSKLLDIWIASKTFPLGMLTDFKNRLHNPAPTATAPPVSNMPSATDAASLLAALAPPLPTQNPAQPSQMPTAQNDAAASALLAALSSLQQQSASNPPALPAPPAPAQQLQAEPHYTQQSTSAYPSQQTPQTQAPQMSWANMQPQAQYQSTPVAPPPFVPPQQPPQPSQQPGFNLGALAALLPNAANQGSAPDPNALVNQLQLLQSLSQQLGPDGFQTLLQALTAQQQQQPAVQPPNHPQQSVPQPPAQNFGSYAAAQRNDYPTQAYSTNQTTSNLPRGRSRSPDWNRSRNTPPKRRESPVYGNYDSNTGRISSPKSRGGRGDYRQRSPHSSNSPMPHQSGTKPIGYDNKLPSNSIKVLSRTLFVGGVKTNESSLRAFFSQFGGVQSCIVNHDKRHAFLKLVTHQDTVATRQAVFHLPEAEYRPLFERVNWAVGFGPTQCADYNTGTSVIALDLLTDADRKWLLTAEHGGTGGKPIAPGMVVEEPDIEIGAGPSSKAIHRRGGGQQGRGGRRGGYNNSSGDQYQQRNQQPRQQRQQAPDNNANSSSNYGPPPAVPTFGAPIPGFPFSFQ